MPTLGMPGMPSRTAERTGSRPIAFTTGHHFSRTTDTDPTDLAERATAPVSVSVSVILQVTKRCDFDCSFCSETMQMKDPTLAQLATMSTNLAGVQRVFLSGGEPLLRRDLIDCRHFQGLHHRPADQRHPRHGSGSLACRQDRVTWITARLAEMDLVPRLT